MPKLQTYLHLKKNKKNPDNGNEDAYEFCCLCSKHKSCVGKLIAGSRGAVCAECLLDAMFLLDSEHASIADNLKYIDKLIIRNLDEQELSGELDKHLVEYLLDKCKKSAIQRDKILGDFLSRENYECTKIILSGIPEGEWRYFEALNWMWCNSMEGDFESALRLPSIKKSDDALENEIYERHLALNRISVKVEINTTEENVKNQLSELFRLKSYFEQEKYPVAPDYGKLMPSVLSNIAQCYYLLDDLNQAAYYLEERKAFSESTDFTELLLGNICEREGNYSKAEGHWRKGLDIQSRGIYADRLRNKLANME